MCLRWLGREQEAIVAINDFDQERWAHADANWWGWLHFEIGTCNLLRGELATAMEHGKQAEDIFSVISRPAGEANALVLLCSIHRIRGDTAAASAALAKAEAYVNVETDWSTEEAWRFEHAEMLRHQGLHEDARVAYESLFNSKSALHRSHAALGLAELHFDTGDHHGATEQALTARKGYQELGCDWGECNAIFTLVRSGHLTTDDGNRQAKATGYQLPGSDLESLLFGHGPRARPLNLP